MQIHNVLPSLSVGGVTHFSKTWWGKFTFFGKHLLGWGSQVFPNMFSFLYVSMVFNRGMPNHIKGPQEFQKTSRLKLQHLLKQLCY